MPTPTPLALPGPPIEVEVDERAARRTLRDQIARLEGELADLQMTAWQSRTPLEALQPVPRRGASKPHATLLPLAALERTRDRLAARAAAARKELDTQGEDQEHARRAREEMLLDPHAHPLARITNAQIGEPGCRDWHVRPRFGLLGMLAGWWRVVVSSGCPLATGDAARAALDSLDRPPATNEVIQTCCKKATRLPTSSSRTRTATRSRCPT